MGSSRQEIVLATGNPHKVEELRAILASGASGSKGLAALDVLGLGDLVARGLGPFAEPDEVGSSFEENAAIKAVSYANQAGMVCIADDSGLEIDALGGRPGVISSHYFNEGRTDGRADGLGRAERDRLNNERVLGELAGVAFEDRGARFVCVMAVAAPNELGSEQGVVLARFRGEFGGRIGLPAGSAGLDRAGRAVPRGAHGFGYDPLFLVAPEFVRTGAELSPDEKNRLSHRAQAAGRLIAWLRGGGLDLAGRR